MTEPGEMGMTKEARWVVRGLVLILVLALSVNTWLGLSALFTADNATGHLALVQRRVAQTQYTFAVSQKASAATRVTTVTQRCGLTQLIVRFLIAHHIPPGAFERSYNGCEKQLVTVEAINNATPTPTPPHRKRR